jgi:hypothetical protein
VGTKTNRPHFEPQEKNGFKKSWYPSDKSTIEMLMDVGSCCCFPNENSSIHPSSGGYRLSLIRCARCPGVKKVPRHRPPPPPPKIPHFFQRWIYNTVATSFFFSLSLSLSPIFKYNSWEIDNNKNWQQQKTGRQDFNHFLGVKYFSFYKKWR